MADSEPSSKYAQVYPINPEDRLADHPMLSSSKSATHITCSSSFTSESSLTLSTENLRASPDLGLTASSFRHGRGSRTPSAGSLLLSVPSERHGLRRFSAQRFSIVPSDTLFEESSELILNCGALSSAVLGRIKSFSTSDITIASTGYDLSSMNTDGGQGGLKSSVSEIAIFGGNVWNPRLDLPNIRSLDQTSRSCSTWVVVGDRSISSVSQLPSPQAHSVTGTVSPTFTPIDIVLSMNKKVRQMYIKSRLLSTYRTLERLSRSQLDLGNIIKGDLGFLIQGHSVPIPQGHGNRLAKSSGLSGSSGQEETSSNEIKEPNPLLIQCDLTTKSTNDSEISNFNNNSNNLTSNNSLKLQERLASAPLDLAQLQNDLYSLTVRDIELQKGKPLTKYERNIMIFNWLQNLDQDDGLQQ